jgi:ribosomal protein S18 acetylase RimI-like enzyme
MPLRAAARRDLETVVTWVTTAKECELWAGRRVQFPIRLAALLDAIAFADTGGFALDVDGTLAAFGQVVEKAGGRAHLARIIVAPGQRGRGTGTALVSGLLDCARGRGHRTASLNVDPSNAIAIALYEKLGFADAARPGDEPDPYGSRYMQRAL